MTASVLLAWSGGKDSAAADERAFTNSLRSTRERWPDLDRIAFGDLHLTDVREYRETLLASCGWSGEFPLWGRETGAFARTVVRDGFRAILSCLNTTLLPPEFAGREYDAKLLADLPSAADPCGERGEFHACVYAGPILDRPLEIVRGPRVRRNGRFEYQDLLLSSDLAG